MGQLDFTISIVLIGLFTIAIIGFAINFAEDNNAPVDISDDSGLTSLKTNTEADVSSIEDSTEDTYTSLLESSVQEGETLEKGGTLSLTVTNAIPVFFNILRVGYSRIFGNDSGFEVFLTAFIGIIIFIGAMYFAKTWLGRNPD